MVFPVNGFLPVNAVEVYDPVLDESLQFIAASGEAMGGSSSTARALLPVATSHAQA
jgi:hypothetical protein